MEWKLFEGTAPEFASAEWYEDREAAHHIDELGHRERLQEAAVLVAEAVLYMASSDHYIQGKGMTLSDLGAGDGGFLQFLKLGLPDLTTWGYDLSPANVHFAGLRGVDVRLTDFASESEILYGDITVLTETLEHLEDPHGVLRSIPSKFIVASCPYTETDEQHYEFHLWAWDVEGFDRLFHDTGWRILKHYTEGMSQFVLAERY